MAILFFFTVYCRLTDPNFWHFPKKKKKSNDVVKLFFTLNDSYNLKDEHSNSIEKKQEQKLEHFFIVYCAFCQSKYVNTYFLTPQCLIYPGLPFQAVTGK